MAKENKADMSCARVKKYTASDVSKAERHNERKNESYEKKEQKHSYLQARGFGRLLYGQIVQFRKSTKSILTNSTPTEDGQESLSYVGWSYLSICKNICICDTGMQNR